MRLSCLPFSSFAEIIDGRMDLAEMAVFGELKPVLIGTGIAPIPAIFDRLIAAGWDGWPCMEEASFQGSAGIEAAARFVRAAWQQACAAPARS